MIMAGGYQKGQNDGNWIREGSTDAVELTRDNGLTFETLAPLPFRDHYGHIFFLDEKTVLYQSMRLWDKPFYLLHLENNTWTEGLKLKYQRVAMHVGMITRPSGEKEIVFVGGSAMGSNLPSDTQACKSKCNKHDTKSVEIYNIANNTLREGKDAPQFMYARMTSPYMDSFIVSPSSSGEDCCSMARTMEIWRYNDDGSMTLMPGKQPRSPYYDNKGIWVDDLC